ncbi:MAG: hypothetical protein PWP24_1768, partial [Clostridiales bacterium]|nr:hypothetical protein [Clostridiales bacterium]
MEQYSGKSIYQKIVTGPIFYYEKREAVVKRKHIEDVEAEKQRFLAAKVEAIRQLSGLYA